MGPEHSVAGNEEGKPMFNVLRLTAFASFRSALIGQVDENVLYLFSNRRRNLIKFLIVNKWGIWVAARRMHHKRFFWPEDQRGGHELTAKELACLLVGGEVKDAFKVTFSWSIQGP